MAFETLHTKYRPKTFDDVVGQDSAVKSLRNVLRQGLGRAFIFLGGAGVGKTTLARVVAHHLGVLSNNILEIDAATHSSVESIREVTEKLAFAGLGKNGKRMIIIDEVHALSKSAFQALLKSLEEPPAHIFFALCTTEDSKVPETIRTRCQVYNLQPVPEEVIEGVITKVAAAEDFDLDAEIVTLIAKKAEGSVRKALTSLGAVAHCKDRKEAAMVLRSVLEDTDLGHLLRAMSKGGLSWQRAMELLLPIKDSNAESNRIVICDYFSKVAMGAKDENSAVAALKILSAFSTPYPQNGGNASLLISLGNIVYG